MNSIMETDKTISELKKKKLLLIERELERFTHQETRRINQEFDDYLAIIEQKRQQVLEDLPRKIEAYFQSRQCLTAGLVKAWEILVEDAKRSDKVKLIKKTSPGSTVNDTLKAIKPSIAQTDKIYEKFITNKQLTIQTLFLRHNLPDISNASLLATSPHNLTQYHDYKTITYPTTTTPTLKTPNEEKKPEKSTKNAENYQEFLDEYCEIYDRYEKEEVVLELGKKEIKDLCEVYKQILKRYSWEFDFRSEEGWNVAILPIMGPYFRE